MILVVIFIGVLILSGYFLGVRTIGLFITMLGFAMLIISPVLAIGVMIFGVILFIGIRSKK